MPRLDVYLAEQLGSRAAAQKAISEGRVTVDGMARPKSFVVDGTEAIEVVTDDFHPEAVPKSAIFEVVFEDADVMVVDKGPETVVHPGAGVKSATLTGALKGRVAGGDDPDRPGVVHRLDRDTTGLLLLTRNPRAWTEMSRQIKAREVEREYLALVKGRPSALSGTIDAPLGRDRRKRTLRSSDTDDPKDAVTHFETQETLEEATLLRVTLETGRTHQIRAHFKAIGHPVLGDKEYGAAYPGLDRQFLHSARIAFAHPTSGERVELRSELPDDLAATLSRLRNPTLR